jgi:hypothetical protein
MGDLPTGTPVAFEAAFGWSWLAGLLEDYGFDAHPVHPLRCKAIASARLDRARPRLTGRAGPPATSREVVTDCLAVIDGLAKWGANEDGLQATPSDSQLQNRC